jgi:hypothetical protein
MLPLGLGMRMSDQDNHAGPQFFSNGCDNCEKFLKLEGDRDKVQGFTTNAFAG